LPQTAQRWWSSSVRRLALICCFIGSANAAGLSLTTVEIKAGRLEITGKADAAGTRVEIPGTQFFTISKADKSFAFSIVYRPANCRVGLKTPAASVNALVGNCGPQGPQGQQGVQGGIGRQGAIGATGAVGAVGPQGVVGLAGLTGPRGPMGPQGQQGIQGPMGPQGSQGIAGPPGPSAVMRSRVCRAPSEYEPEVDGYRFCFAACLSGEVGIAGWVEILDQATSAVKSGAGYAPYYGASGRYVVGWQLPESELAASYVSATAFCFPRS
jgi:hypothetical protein